MSKRWEVIFSWDRLKKALKDKNENIVSDDFFAQLRPFRQAETKVWAEKVAEVFMAYIDATQDFQARVVTSFSYQMLLIWRYLQRYNYTFQFVHKRGLRKLQKTHPHPLVDRLLVAVDFWLGEWDQALYTITQLIEKGSRDPVVWEYWVYITFVRSGHLARVDAITEKAQAAGFFATDLLRMARDVDFTEPWYTRLEKACAQDDAARHERMKGLLRCMVYHRENDAKNRRVVRSLGLIGCKEEAGGLWMVDARSGLSIRWLMNRTGFSNIPSRFVREVITRLRKQWTDGKIDAWWGLRIFPDLEMVPNVEDSMQDAQLLRDEQKRIASFEEKVIVASQEKRWDDVIALYRSHPEMERSLSSKRWIAKAHYETLDWERWDRLARVRRFYQKVSSLAQMDASYWLRRAKLQRALGYYTESFRAYRRALRFGANVKDDQRRLAQSMSQTKLRPSFAQIVRQAWAQFASNAWFIKKTAHVGFANAKDIQELQAFCAPILDDVVLQMVTLENQKKLVRIHLFERLDLLGPMLYFVGQMPESLKKDWIFEVGGTILGVNERALHWEMLRKDVRWFVRVRRTQQFSITLYHPQFAKMPAQQRRIFEQRIVHYVMKYLPEEHIIRWVDKLEMASAEDPAWGQRMPAQRVLAYMESMVPSVLRHTMSHVLEERQRLHLPKRVPEQAPWTDTDVWESAWGLFAVMRLRGQTSAVRSLWRLGVSVGVLACRWKDDSVVRRDEQEALIENLTRFLRTQAHRAPHHIFGVGYGQCYSSVEVYWYETQDVQAVLRDWHRAHPRIARIIYCSYEPHAVPQVWSQWVDQTWRIESSYS